MDSKIFGPANRSILGLKKMKENSMLEWRTKNLHLVFTSDVSVLFNPALETCC